jgi:1-acyl-sn-glycerol-3-phosphate acyltransferase
MMAYKTVDRLGLRPFLRLLFRIEVNGAERIPEHGACIITANHESLADPFILGVATRRKIRYMAKAELFRFWPLGAAMRAFGTFAVERGAGHREAISAAAQLLEVGEVLGIFPQGTSKRIDPRPYRRGAARLALATGAPIVPVLLVGTRGILRPGFPKVRIFVGEPIHVERGRSTVAEAGRLMERVERQILDLAA